MAAAADRPKDRWSKDNSSEPTATFAQHGDLTRGERKKPWLPANGDDHRRVCSVSSIAVRENTAAATACEAIVQWLSNVLIKTPPLLSHLRLLQAPLGCLVE